MSIAVVGIANGKRSVEIDSVRIIKKKGTPTTANSAINAQDQTPEAGSGQYLTSDPIVPQAGEGVKGSIPDSGAENADLLRGISDLLRGNTATEQAAVDKTDGGQEGAAVETVADDLLRRIQSPVNAGEIPKWAADHYLRELSQRYGTDPERVIAALDAAARGAGGATKSAAGR